MFNVENLFIQIKLTCISRVRSVKQCNMKCLNVYLTNL